jgi:hypothetical protein
MFYKYFLRPEGFCRQKSMGNIDRYVFNILSFFPSFNEDDGKDKEGYRGREESEGN